MFAAILTTLSRMQADGDKAALPKQNQRIVILDGFRALAILSVLFYHYFSRWLPPLSSLYPYGSKYNYFGYGGMGVMFFFIISGFVIFFTLDHTTNRTAFWKKRFIRLFPSMTIASVFTFTLLILFDNEYLFPYGQSLPNLITSITFISPDLLEIIHVKVKYLSVSYWSLWPEIQFYFIAGLLFFINKKTFLRNYLILSFLLIIGNHLLLNIGGSNKLHIPLSPAFLKGYEFWVSTVFNIPRHLVFFTIGVLFYDLYKCHHQNEKVGWSIKLSLMFFIAYTFYPSMVSWSNFIYVLMYLAFFVFIYKPRWVSWLESKWLVIIGISSYFLYLIHDNVGVLLIHKFGKYFYPVEFIFSLLVMTFLVSVSYWYTLTIDKKLSKYLKQKLF